MRRDWTQYRVRRAIGRVFYVAADGRCVRLSRYSDLRVVRRMLDYFLSLYS